MSSLSDYWQKNPRGFARLISLVSTRRQWLFHRWQLRPLFFTRPPPPPPPPLTPPAVLILKCITGSFQLYCTAEGRWDACTSKNEKGRGGGGEMEETKVTMKDLWQALRAGGGFISLLSTKSPPLRCSTYSALLCSLALSLSLSVRSPPLTLFPDQCSPLLPSLLHYLTFPTQPHAAHSSSTSPSVFSHLSPPSFLVLVSLALSVLLGRPLCLSGSVLSHRLIALTTSLLSFALPLPPSPRRWSIFCLLCLRRRFPPPPHACLHVCLSPLPIKALNQWQFTPPPFLLPSATFQPRPLKG